MKKYSIVAIISIIIGMIAGYALPKKATELTELERANYDTLPYKIEVIQAQNEYIEACEALLDSIYNATDWSADLFMDVVMETDTYYNYEVARERVGFLSIMEDNAELSWEDYKQFLQRYDLQPYQQDLKD